FFGLSLGQILILPLLQNAKPLNPLPSFLTSVPRLLKICQSIRGQMSKSRLLYQIIVLAIFSLVLSACSQSVSTEEVMMTPGQCYAEEDQGIGKYPGWSWLGMTVGYSTEQDLVAKLGKPKSVFPWPTNVGKPLACVYRYQLEDWPKFWLAKNKIIGIEFSKSTVEFHTDELPGTLHEAKSLYGRPELVGWSSIYGAGYRSVVWLNRGIQAEVAVGGDCWIANILYFTPMGDDEFDASLWSQLVLTTNPTLNSDQPDTMPRDPFDWDR
ncbi:MAG: hypothetical protein AB1894_28975, partial [Chloroflexota bacterium]